LQAYVSKLGATGKKVAQFFGMRTFGKQWWQKAKKPEAEDIGPAMRGTIWGRGGPAGAFKVSGMEVDPVVQEQKKTNERLKELPADIAKAVGPFLGLK